MMTDHPSEALLNACDGSHDDDHHNIDEEEEDVHFQAETNSTFSRK